MKHIAGKKVGLRQGAGWWGVDEISEIPADFGGIA
jgi:hypothetical protein